MAQSTIKIDKKIVKYRVLRPEADGAPASLCMIIA